jgi:hypothetical protein
MRDQRLRKMAYEVDQLAQDSSPPSQQTEATERLDKIVTLDEDNDNAPASLELHHVIGTGQKNFIHIGSWLEKHEGDPATKVCCTFRSL